MREEFVAGGPGEEGLEPERMLADDGRPPHGRRLTDKILHAYTQAYAQGETRLATSLRRLLQEAEERGRQLHPERRGVSAVRQADLWNAFCDARELYRQAVAPRSEQGGPQAGRAQGRGVQALGAERSGAAGQARLQATLELMRIAYLRWRRAA